MFRHDYIDHVPLLGSWFDLCPNGLLQLAELDTQVQSTAWYKRTCGHCAPLLGQSTILYVLSVQHVLSIIPGNKNLGDLVPILFFRPAQAWDNLA